MGFQHRRTAAGHGATPAKDREVKVVEIGGLAVSRDRSCIVQSPPIGAGVVVLLYDPELRLAGMLHFMLPNSVGHEAKCATHPALFGDAGVELLMRQMTARGAGRDRLKCYIVGGADPIQRGISAPVLSLGQRNVESAREQVAAMGLAITAARTGEHCARKIVIEVGSGTVRVTETPTERKAS